MNFLDLESVEIEKRLVSFVEHPAYKKLYKLYVNHLYDYRSTKTNHIISKDDILTKPPNNLVIFGTNSQIDLCEEVKRIFNTTTNNKQWKWYFIPNDCTLNCALILYPALTIMFPEIKWYILDQNDCTIVSNRDKILDEPSAYTDDVSKPVCVSIENHFCRKYIAKDWGTGYFTPGPHAFAYEFWNQKKVDTNKVYDNWDDIKELIKDCGIDNISAICDIL
uniref:Uncharacterized protein n=1 Tax=Marseillevirus LCMAC102 TaxID=2506603 RepID=A0A481YUT1_9VIRU|nr:MAG: hypothetical protein LCMAC102_00890 [Marseillevirus LCMAC102]